MENLGIISPEGDSGYISRNLHYYSMVGGEEFSIDSLMEADDRVEYLLRMRDSDFVSENEYGSRMELIFNFLKNLPTIEIFTRDDYSRFPDVPAFVLNGEVLSFNDLRVKMSEMDALTLRVVTGKLERMYMQLKYRDPDYILM